MDVESGCGCCADCGKRKRVLVVDPVHKYALQKLGERFDVVQKIHPEKEELISLLKESDVIVLRSGIKLPADVISQSDRLKVIARAGSGVDNIDVSAASQQGVLVFNVPAVSARSVAELTFGLAFSVSRKVALADRWLRSNQWRKKECAGYELTGKTIGLVGVGKIGLEVAQIAQGLGMNVIGYKRDMSEMEVFRMKEKGVTLVPLSELLQKADFVTLHLPLDDSTRNLITINEFQRMKETAFLINVARGGIVNETDLYQALKQGMIAGAATDVYETEREFSTLFELDNIVVTPHIGAMTHDSQKRIAEILCENIFNAVDGKEVKNRIN